jgi:hypothetical protein
MEQRGFKLPKRYPAPKESDGGGTMNMAFSIPETPLRKIRVTS